MKMTLLEIAVDNLQDALYAQAAGADRLEVCSRLDVGGCTPDPSMFADVRRQTSIPLFPMVRPRGGSFVYSGGEIAEMVREIQILKDLGASGIVSGALKDEGTIDERTVADLLLAADPLPFTFHRAFDRVQGKTAALSQLIRVGVERLLTSGGTPSAEEGLTEISKLMSESEDRIIVIPGGGVRPANIVRIALSTGAREIHSSGRGAESAVDPSVVKRMRELLDDADRHRPR